MTATRKSPEKSATLYKLGTKKKGLDGNIWIIKESVNGVKRWTLYRKQDYKIQVSKKKTKNESSKKGSSKKMSKKGSKNKPKKKSLETYYDIVKVSDKKLKDIFEQSKYNNIYIKLKNNIIPELKKLGFYAEIISVPLSKKGMSWSDYPDSILTKKYGNEWVDNNHLYVTIPIDVTGRSLNMNREIRANFSPLNVENKKKVIMLFEKYLPSNFIWNGSNMKSILIPFDKTKVEKIDKNKLSDDDVNPLLILTFEFKKPIELNEVDKMVNIIFDDLHDDIEDYDHDYSYSMYDISINLFKVYDKKLEKKLEKYCDKFIKNDKNIGYDIKYGKN